MEVVPLPSTALRVLVEQPLPTPEYWARAPCRPVPGRRGTEVVPDRCTANHSDLPAQLPSHDRLKASDA